jgi:hypothetical protein
LVHEKLLQEQVGTVADWHSNGLVKEKVGTQKVSTGAGWYRTRLIEEQVGTVADWHSSGLVKEKVGTRKFSTGAGWYSGRLVQ